MLHRSVSSVRGLLFPCVVLLSACFTPVAIVGAADDPPVSLETVKVEMRDGVRLATDLYRRPGIERGPVLLMRTPYNKERTKPVAERFARAGYITLVQDCRGKFQSEGTFIPYDHEGQDGFDAVEWVNRQPWCDGKIGMWGSSYVGATQWQAAVAQPPGLVTITPTATFSSFYRNLYLGGAVRLSLITRWASGNSPKPESVMPPTDWDATLLHLPLSDFDRAIGWPIPWLSGMLTHPTPNGYWNRLDMTERITRLDLPIQHVVGYYDFFSRESVGNFVRMRNQARNPRVREQQQLILGPWDHGTIGAAQVGEVDFGPNAVWDAAGENLLWFDRFLKQDPAVTKRPLVPVRYFSMGENVWKEAQSWPPEGVVQTPFYLHSKGKANTRAGDGVLSRTAPVADQSADSFQADPAKPTPACPPTEKRPLNAATWAPVDQRPIEDRNDVLVYTSEPLDKPLTFAGDAQAELYVEADTPDADWVVKLVDVRPDGFAYNLAVGIQRGSFRDSESSPQPLKPGTVYKLTIDLGPVAAQLAEGHRLRVDISGAYFPLFDRNTNTGDGPYGARTAVSTETVHHSKLRASRILLPGMSR
ncbi:MAG: CocE/NonD family hydrolase [Planctomycetota bacterium]|nr:CocE/NonD family hydrolase [Planctomycetota bacterium]